MGVAKWWVLVGIGMLSAWVPNPAQAQQAPGGVTPKNGAPPPSRVRSVVDEQALTELYGAAKGNPTPGGPRIHQTADGFLRFFGSAPTASYQLKSTPLAQDPESIAKGFVSDYAGAFYTCASQIIIRTGIIEVSRCSQKHDMPWLQNETHINSRCSYTQKEHHP